MKNFSKLSLAFVTLSLTLYSVNLYADDGNTLESSVINTQAEQDAQTGNQMQVGTELTFGSYYNINDQVKEPLIWEVLEIKDDKALIITKNVIEVLQYHNVKTDTCWANSTLRMWLNDTFISNAFLSDDKSRIVDTEVMNTNNPDYHTSSGNNTKDKVFLLSIDEATKYFKDEDSLYAAPSAYAKSKNVYSYHGQATWWLRTLGHSKSNASYVSFDGEIISLGSNVAFKRNGVRPALWLKL